MRRNFFVSTCSALMLAVVFGSPASAATLTITVSQNPANSPTTNTLQGALNSLNDGDVATVEILDSGTYDITDSLLDGFDDGTVHLKASLGQFPTLDVQTNTDVFELDNNTNGTQLGDDDGGRIRINMEGAGSHTNRIFMIRTDGTQPVIVENWLVDWPDSMEPGGGIVIYNNQNSDPSDPNAPPNEIEINNAVFQVNGKLRDGFRRHNSANIAFERVSMQNTFRYAFWPRGDTGDARNDEDVDGGPLGDPGSMTCLLTDWRNAGGDRVWRSQDVGNRGLVIDIDRSWFKGQNSADLVLQQGVAHDISIRRTGFIFEGGGGEEIWQDTSDGDWLGRSISFDHCAFVNLADGPAIALDDTINRTVSVQNSNFFLTGESAFTGSSGGIQSDYNNIYTSNVDALDSGSVYGSVNPGSNDVLPGQDPEYGASLVFGNFIYSNSFLKTADAVGGPIGINDNLSDVIGYVIPNQVKHWNLY